ncbi:SAM-dependent methyltransferase [Patescibacteria group bacterium]|nr:SAM-dependent methyltransferase [Patescibacteria group bacterium]
MSLDYLAFVLLSLAVLGACGWLLWMFWQGPPYVPSKDEAIKEMLDLAGVKKGERVAELGSGDGRLAIAPAKQGALVDGFEINPILVWTARKNARKAGVSTHVTFTRKNFWRVDLSPYAVVTTFGIPHVMERLGRKLKRESKPGTRVVSNVFPIPGPKRIGKTKRALRYRVN